MTGIAEILEYVRSFLVLFLIIKVLLFLIPSSVFSRYISFFSGIILVIGILHPALQLLQLDEIWLKRMYDTTFENQMLEVSGNVALLEKRNQEFTMGQMKEGIEAEIKREMEQTGVIIEKVSVELSKNYQIDRLEMTISGEKEEAHENLMETLREIYQLSAEQCEIAYE